MSGSQHNPNGRQAQLGSGWSPLQLQMANLLARAPQAHMASDRGVTWHTPTPPPHLYHVPAPSPPDPLQAMKGAGNSVFRHTATPPELYRHTPTPPDKHLLRHTPSPGDVKSGAALPPAELYAHMGPQRDKLVRPEDLLSYARGVDLSLSSRSANGAGPHGAAPALSVRDAPTINSLIARAGGGPRPLHARLDSLLERLAPPPEPHEPHSVIVHSRAAPTPSPPSSEDSADSCGAPPGAKRKRKPERTLRVPTLVPVPLPVTRITPPKEPIENGDAHVRNGPETARPLEPHARRKTRSGSAETIDDIAAMIASTDDKGGAKEPPKEEPAPAEPPVTIDKLKSVLASPDTKDDRVEELAKSPPKAEEKAEPQPEPLVEAAAPRRRSARSSNAEATNAPVESPSEAKPAEPEPAAAAAVAVSAASAPAVSAASAPAVSAASAPAVSAAAASAAAPTAASFVEVENQLEKMFAGIEEEPVNQEGEQRAEKEKPQTTKARKRRKSAPTKGERKAARRSSRASTGEDKKKGKKAAKKSKEAPKDAYDSGSNASSGRSRGPYIQIVGPRDSPLSVLVVNAGAEEEGEGGAGRRDRFRNGLRARGLHCSTLGLRYDATTPDATWLCAFCERGPHAAGLGDLFGPYPLDTDCDEYRALEESARRRQEGAAWLHEACAVWAPGLLAAGARLWGLAGAVWSCRGARCGGCGRGGAGVACRARGCRARAHVPCARAAPDTQAAQAAPAWALREDELHALCPQHAAAPHS